MNRFLALALVCVSVTACGSIFPKPHASRLYQLTALSSGEKTADGSRQVSDRGEGENNPSTPISVGIGPIQLPGYLDRQEIVFRVEPNRFEILEYDRWAEPLDENFSRVLLQNLSALLRTDQIFVYPWPRGKKLSYRIDVQVLRFDSNSLRAAELVARWTITDVNRKEEAASNELRVVRDAKDDSVGTAVTALSETLGNLSTEIARALMKQVDSGRHTTSESAAPTKN